MVPQQHECCCYLLSIFILSHNFCFVAVTFWGLLSFIFFFPFCCYFCKRVRMGLVHCGTQLKVVYHSRQSCKIIATWQRKEERNIQKNSILHIKINRQAFRVSLLSFFRISDRMQINAVFVLQIKGNKILLQNFIVNYNDNDAIRVNILK